MTDRTKVARAIGLFANGMRMPTVAERLDMDLELERVTVELTVAADRDPRIYHLISVAMRALDLCERQERLIDRMGEWVGAAVDAD